MCNSAIHAILPHPRVQYFAFISCPKTCICQIFFVPLRDFSRMNDLYYDMDTINIDIKWLVDGWSIAKVRSLIQEKPEVLFVAHLAQDNRDIPPMMAICTMVQDTYVPVCRGFCALLVHWAIGDAFNRKVAVNADSFTLEFEDFNFDFEEFIPVNDLIKAYLNKVKLLYSKMLECSPRKAHILEDENQLFTMIYLNEYEYYFHFLRTVLANQFNEKQVRDFIDYWNAFRNYIVRHYRITTRPSEISEFLIKEFIDEGILELPKNMTLEQFIDADPEMSIGQRQTKGDNEPKVIQQITMNFYSKVGQAIANVETLINKQ